MKTLDIIREIKAEKQNYEENISKIRELYSYDDDKNILEDNRYHKLSEGGEYFYHKGKIYHCEEINNKYVYYSTDDIYIDTTTYSKRINETKYENYITDLKACAKSVLLDEPIYAIDNMLNMNGVIEEINWVRESGNYYYYNNKFF